MKIEYRVKKLGEARYDSPLGLSLIHGDRIANFVSEDARIVVNPRYEYWRNCRKKGWEPETFELAGPREKLFFHPERTKVAIVTCGGLCPGLNDVVRALVMELYYHYRVRDILGIRYGFRGMTRRYGGTAMPLTPEIVAEVHKRGGSFLGSSRGEQNVVEMVDFLQRREINILFTIGGDGTTRGAIAICEECASRQLPVAVVGIPKTIDNDIAFIDRSFGFSSAVARAKEVIDSAHAEALGACYGIGLVKLMGRHSGHIAARASLASGEVNFVLIPESPFELEGPHGFLKHLEQRLRLRKHAVVVVAEGAGQELIPDSDTRGSERDPSGNLRLKDIGLHLKNEIKKYFRNTDLNVVLKYFDPSYYIRSTTANAEDSVYCSELAQHAVHAAFSGRTEMIVGTWRNCFVHIPMELAIKERKTLNIEGQEWLAVVENTGQPYLMVNHLAVKRKK